MKFRWLRKAPLPPIEIAPVKQPANMNDEERQMVRAAAALEVQTSLALRDRILTEVSTSLRWVQTSLLVVNGGAALAVLQSDALGASSRGLAGAIFVLGIICSLLSAYAGVLSAQDVPRRLTELAGYWLSVSIDLLRSDEIERDWLEYGRHLPKRGRWSRLLGWASLAAFVCGCIVVGVAIL
jgi:hypothetical protein